MERLPKNMEALMAYRPKNGRGYRNRQFPESRPTKYPKGYDRWGMPIVCGLIEADGKECLNKTSSYGLCDEHRAERHRELGLLPAEPEEST